MGSKPDKLYLPAVRSKLDKLYLPAVRSKLDQFYFLVVGSKPNKLYLPAVRSKLDKLYLPAVRSKLDQFYLLVVRLEPGQLILVQPSVGQRKLQHDGSLQNGKLRHSKLIIRPTTNVLFTPLCLTGGLRMANFNRFLPGKASCHAKLRVTLQS